MHDKVRESLEAQKQQQSAGGVFAEVVSQYNRQVHGDNTCIREKHDSADVGLASKVALEIVPKGKSVVHGKDGNTDCNTQDTELGEIGSVFKQKYAVNKVKKTVMYCKKDGCLALSGFGGGDGLIVDGKTFGGELLEAKYPSPIEKADDNTLAPVDPHDIG